MNIKINNFIPINFIAPRCDIITVEHSKKGYWFDFFVTRVGGWKFYIYWKSFRYDKRKNYFIISKTWQLPIILEIQKEFIINNTKNNDI